MNPFLKKFLTYPLTPLLFLGFGSLLITLSCFFPYVQFHEQTNFFVRVIVGYELIKKFAQKDIIQLIILFILLYPYLFAVTVLILFSGRIRSFSRLFTPSFKKLKQLNEEKISYLSNIKILKFPVILVKYIFLLLFSFIKTFFLLLLNYLGLLINLYVYLGFFMFSQKGFIVSVFGIILVAVMLLSFYYFHRFKKIQSERCSKALYLGLSYGTLSFIYFIMIFILLNLKQFDLLVGSYGSLIGSGFVLFGMILYLENTKLYHPEKLVPLTEEKKVIKPSLFSGLKKETS